jgi:surface polysaccharide O-acyltransferase-like enzyme
MRISGIDTMRVIAILAVITIHTGIMRGSFAHGIFDQLARFAVPFFFITAGYLFYKKNGQASGRQLGKQTTQYIFRIAVIFAFWSIFYMGWSVIYQTLRHIDKFNNFSSVLPIQFNLRLNDFVKHYSDYIMVGGAVHLWFLPALGSSIFLLAIAIKYNKLFIITQLSIVLFIVMLLAGPYNQVIVNIPKKYLLRNWPFFCSFFVFIGANIARYNIRTSFSKACLLFIIGAFLQLGESITLWKLYGKPICELDFLFGTLLFGTGAFLIALLVPHFGEKIGINKLGKYTLGIYVIHLWVASIFSLYFRHEAIRIAGCFGFSCVITILMSRVPIIKKMVT